jgi:3-oxoacyl-[acyl-carrier protein] reductase
LAIYPELQGRAVAITGAANGIGEVAARAFAAQGAQVYLLDIDGAGISRIGAEIAAPAHQAQAVRVDVTDEASVAQAFAAITAGGGLDVLVNCAGGYGKLASIEDMDLGEWERTVALNLRSVFLCSRAAIPLLKKSAAGRIINVASISGRTVHAASSPAYGSAKAGVIQFTRFLAYELGQYNITANSISPLTTLTPRVAALRTPEQIEKIAAQVPLKRLATPEDHVNAMLFLASDAASFINGAALDTNGGRVMM